MINLTASDLPRVMACNGSVFMKEPEYTSSGDTTVRDEGLTAHWLAEQVHSGKFEADELIDRKSPYGVYITAEMVEYLQTYLRDIECQGTILEYRNTYSFDGGTISGRADLVKYLPNIKTLYIADLKYGWSIHDVVKNWTLISHAVGYVTQNPDVQIDKFVFAIYQPRPYHRDGDVRDWELSATEFNEYRTNLLTRLSNLEHVLTTNLNHCPKCPHFTSCPAARKAKMNAIDATERVFDDKISNEQLAVEIKRMKNASGYIKKLQSAYIELAEHRLKNNEIIDGYGLEASISNTAWKENVTPALLKMLTGKDFIDDTKLVTPAEAKRRGMSEPVYASMTERRKTGVKLVEVDVNDKATKMFGKKENKT